MANSYFSQTTAATYRAVEKTRKREYQQRVIEVEGGTFTPMIMSSSGGMGGEMTVAVKHLARQIADKNNEEYSVVVGAMRARFAFAILRAGLVCLRGSRSIRPQNLMSIAVDRSLATDNALLMAECR